MLCNLVGKMGSALLWLGLTAEIFYDEAVLWVDKTLEPKAMGGFNLHFIAGQIAILPKTTIAAVIVDRMAIGMGLLVEIQVLKFGLTVNLIAKK